MNSDRRNLPYPKDGGVPAGIRAEGATHLQCAVALYRDVGASAYLREAEVLLAATA
jgi:hypothetical protein